MRSFLLAAIALLPAIASAGPLPAPAPVQSVNGATGAVSITNSSIGAQPNSIYVRPPNSTDVTGYQVGGLWIDGTNQPWQLIGNAGGVGQWTKAGNPGLYPATAVPVFKGVWGTDCLVQNWTGAIFTLWRPTDQTTIEVSCVNGGPDLNAMLAFLAPSAGIGYVTKVHDQSDGGAYDNTLTSADDLTVQTIPNNAPRIGLDYVTSNGHGGYNVPLAFDSVLRVYWEAVSSWALTNTSGSANFSFSAISSPTYPTAMSSGTSGLWMMYPGTNVSGTGITGGTTISTYNPVTNSGTLSAVTTANNPNVNLSYGNNAVFYQLPAALTLPMQANGEIFAVRAPAYSIQTGGPSPVALGVTTSSALNSFPMLGYDFLSYGQTVATPGGGRQVDNISGVNNTNGISGLFVNNSDQVLAFSNGGTNGRNLNYQINGQQGSITNFSSSLTNTNLTSGLIGQNPSVFGTFNSALNKGQDFFIYDYAVAGSTLTPAQISTYTLSDDLMRGWKPQGIFSLLCDGSSTTVGNGTTSPGMWCHTVADRLTAAGHPVTPWNNAQSAVVHGHVYNYQSSIGIFYDYANSQSPIEVYYPGEGNTMQQTGNLTITGTSGNTVTTSTTLYSTAGFSPSTNAAPGVYLSGSPGGCLATPTQLLAFVDSTHFTTNPAPNSNCTTITVENDSAANTYSALQQYDAESGASLVPYVEIGSASRGTFYGNLEAATSPIVSTAPYGSGYQWSEFASLKAAMYVACNPNLAGYSASCSGFPNMRGYYDLEMDPLFGGDLGATTVASVTDSTHVVVNTTGTAAANNLVAGNRIEWATMPINMGLTTDTGFQTITAVSGASSPYTLTLSVSTSGMTAGEVVRAISINPWATYPCGNSGVGFYSLGVWNRDTQHYCDGDGYQDIAAKAADALLKTGLLR